MVNQVSSNVNILQLMRAQQAFKTASQNNINPVKDDITFDDPDVKLSITSGNINTEKILQQPQSEEIIQKDKYVSEIKEFMGKISSQNLDEEEIKYAMRYGTSVLVDQSA